MSGVNQHAQLNLSQLEDQFVGSKSSEMWYQSALISFLFIGMSHGMVGWHLNFAERIGSEGGYFTLIWYNQHGCNICAEVKRGHLEMKLVNRKTSISTSVNASSSSINKESWEHSCRLPFPQNSRTPPTSNGGKYKRHVSLQHNITWCPIWLFLSVTSARGFMAERESEWNIRIWYDLHEMEAWRYRSLFSFLVVPDIKSG